MTVFKFPGIVWTGKHFMRSQSETSVFKFLRGRVNAALKPLDKNIKRELNVRGKISVKTPVLQQLKITKSFLYIARSDRD